MFVVRYRLNLLIFLISSPAVAALFQINYQGDFDHGSFQFSFFFLEWLNFEQAHNF